MTRLAILSDIHGNLPALDAVLEDMRPFEVDHVVVAGDSINWGPFSLEVMHRLHEINASIMRGNHELYLLDIDTPRMPDKWRNYNMSRLLVQDLPPEIIYRIACLPDTLQLRFRDAPPVRVVHGTPDNHWQGIFPLDSDAEIRAKIGDFPETTLIAGHTHLCLSRQVDGKLILNPGSVGVMLDRNPNASYLVLDGDANGWRPTFRRVVYDHEALFEGFAQKRYGDRMGLELHLMQMDFRTAYPNMRGFRQWKADFHPDEILSLKLIEAFFELDDGAKDCYVSCDYRKANLTLERQIS